MRAIPGGRSDGFRRRHRVALGVLPVVVACAVALGVDRQSSVAQSRSRLVGDMILDIDANANAWSGPLGGLLDTTFPWPGGTIPVEFAPELSADYRASFFWACDFWSKFAAVQCVPRTSESTYLRAMYSPTVGYCASSVGIGPTGGMREIDMNPLAGCHDPRVFLHEIGHSLGFRHEHQRVDRDLYVTINYANINPAVYGPYQIVPGTPVGAYDFRSVMHYPWLSIGALDSSVPTIVPKPGFEQFARTMGGPHPTLLDGAALRTLYGGTQGPFTAFDSDGQPNDFYPSGNLSRSPVPFTWKPPDGNPIPVASYRFQASYVGQSTPYLDVALPPTALAYLAPLQPGQQWVRVVAKDIASFSWNSGSVGLTISAAPGPPAMTVIQGAANPVSFAWTAGAGGAPTGFRLHVGTSPGASNLAVVDVGLQTSATFTVPLGQPVFARVEAFNMGGSATSNEVSVAVPNSGTPVLAPGVVTRPNLTLSWAPPSAGPAPTAYTIVASLTAGGPLIAQVPVGTQTSIMVTAPDGTFFIRVLATVNGAAVTSNEIRVDIAPPAVPAAPIGMAATVAGSVITFGWQPPSGSTVTSYVLEAGTATGLSNLATLPLGAATTFVTPPVPNGSYYVRVRAQNASGTGPASNEVRAIVGQPPPGPPTLTGSGSPGGNVSLSWSAPTSGAAVTGYELHAGTAPGLSDIVVIPLPAVQTVLATGGVPAGVYYVRVVATSASGLGTFSNEVALAVQ
jgi:Astacin (Peptidase family M12A)